MADQERVATAPRPRGRDLTRGPITRTLLLFALPTLASNALQSLNGSINAIWVGKFLGEQALAATSNANLVMFLMFSAVFGFGMAATILIGQAWGRGDVDAARRALGTTFGLFSLASVVVALAGWVGADPLLRLLATPPEAHALALAYLRVIFVAMPASFLLVLLTMGLRGSGDAITPLVFMGLSSVLDMALNPVLILGLGPAPRLGIAGAATATALANYLALAGLVAYIYLRDLPLRLRGREFGYLRPDAALLRPILAKGLPMGLQMIVFSAAGLALIGLVNRQGVEVTAAYGVSQQLWTYVQMPAMAVGAAVSAMAAQNIGAGRWDRIGPITRAGMAVNFLLTGGLVVLLLAVDRQALGLFLPAGSPALAIARHIQLLASWSFIPFGMTLILSATVRANGAVYAPLVTLAIALFPVRLGFATAAQRWLGSDALWISFSVGSLVSLALMGLFYRYGRWRGGAAMLEPIEAEEQAAAASEPAGRLQPTG